VYAVGVNGRLCVLMDGMGCFEFWSFYAYIDIMWYMLLVLMAMCHPAWVVYLKTIKNIL
jgi:hypothetical protein